MFSYVAPEQRVRQDHPLLAIRRMTDEVLTTLSPRFNRMYSDMGRLHAHREAFERGTRAGTAATARATRRLGAVIDL